MQINKFNIKFTVFVLNSFILLFFILYLSWLALSKQEYTYLLKRDIKNSSPKLLIYLTQDFRYGNSKRITLKGFRLYKFFVSNQICY